MYDQYNRKIDYLRISLTDRCNLHCRYCQPEVSEHVPHNEILRYEELLRICRAALQLGIRKFKITGGEPLLRKGCNDFIASLKQMEGVEQVTLTTNGTLLSQQLPALIAAGVDSINVSLDTLDAAYYIELTGGSLGSVLQALQQLQAAGIPFKLNCVPLAENGFADIMALLQLADKYNAPLRFIELMPLDCNVDLKGLSGSESVVNWSRQACSCSVTHSATAMVLQAIGASAVMQCRWALSNRCTINFALSATGCALPP